MFFQTFPLQVLSLRTIARLFALFYGSQMLLSAIGMGIFCYLSPTMFSDVSEQTGVDVRLFLLTVGLIPQVGLGILLICFGLPPHIRQQTFLVLRNVIGDFLKN